MNISLSFIVFFFLSSPFLSTQSLLSKLFFSVKRIKHLRGKAEMSYAIMLSELVRKISIDGKPIDILRLRKTFWDEKISL